MITKDKRKEILAYFSENTNTDLSYCIRVKSGKAGKNIFISCSTHGSEPVGARFAYQFMRSNIKLQSGSVTFLLANPKSFEKNERYIDKDLNRSFEEVLHPERNYEHSRVAEIRRYLDENRYDLFIDLHSVSLGDFQIIFTNKNSKESIDVVKHNITVRNVFLYEEKDLPGNMCDEFIKRNIPSFGIECGNHESEEAIKTAEKQVTRILRNFGFIEGKIKHEPLALNMYRSVGKIKAGPEFKWLLKDPESYVKLEEGEHICEDMENGVQLAPKDCFLFVPSKAPKPSDEDAGFFVEKMS
jgi:predicted deacylase